MKKLNIFFLVILLFIANSKNSNSKELILFEIKEESYKVMEGKIQLSGLKPNHRYQLTINGYINHPSNSILKKYYSVTDDGQGYYDFKKVNSNQKGIINCNFKTKLHPGIYRVKFLVKDISDNWLTIHCENEVSFEVKNHKEIKYQYQKNSPRNKDISINTVKVIQELLNKSGYNAGTVDGLIGSKTINAVKAFQKDKGLPETGLLSKDLLNQLIKPQ